MERLATADYVEAHARLLYAICRASPKGDQIRQDFASSINDWAARVRAGTKDSLRNDQDRRYDERTADRILALRDSILKQIES